jgi:PAS domain S-box-containing protein
MNVSMSFVIAFALVCLVSTAICLAVGVWLYGKNSSHMINKMFLILCGILFYYGFSEFQYFRASDFQAALFWIRIGAFWYLLPAFEASFAVVYANLKVKSKNILFAFIYAPAVLLSLFEGSTLPYHVTMYPWGWDYDYTGFFVYVQLGYIILTTTGALYIIARKHRSSNVNEEKMGAAYVFFGALIPIVAGVSSTIVSLLWVELPDLTVPAAAIGFLFVGYGVLRHGNFILTSSATAEDILHNMADTLLLIDSSGEVVLANEAASRLLQYEETDLIGMQINTLAHDPSILNVFLRDSAPNSFETRFRTGDGRSIPVLVSKSTITTKRGSTVGHVLVCLNNADRKRLEEQLAQMQRMAAIGEAAAMVGHDLRNPLQAIAMTLYLVKKLLNSGSIAEAKEAMQRLDGLDSQISYMDKIVSDLQNYASPLRPEPAKVSTYQLLKEALSTIAIPPCVKVSVTVDKGAETLNADPDLIKRVFVNLITNAIQAMPEGGELKIAAQRTGEEELVSFQDTGCGIPKEALPKLFVPLFTTKAQGQGLGLAVCKRVMEAHRGTITVRSEVGKGSTFTVTVPVNKSVGGI